MDFHYSSKYPYQAIYIVHFDDFGKLFLGPAELAGPSELKIDH